MCIYVIIFQFGGGVGQPGTTLVYPQEIRQVVRDRFPESGAGAYDAQYEDGNVSMTICYLLSFLYYAVKS